MYHNKLTSETKEMSRHTLVWTGSIQYPGLVWFQVPSDGSCFFHSLLLAYNQNYRLEKQNGHSMTRKDIVKKLRHELSLLLAIPINPLEPTSPRHYDLLARGSLARTSTTFHEYSLENMQRVLDSDQWIDYMYFEFICDALDKDLYILDFKKQDVYLTREEESYQKGRDSIVLGFTGSHYVLVGILDENGVTKTVFSPNTRFITTLGERQSQLQH